VIRNSLIYEQGLPRWYVERVLRVCVCVCVLVGGGGGGGGVLRLSIGASLRNNSLQWSTVAAAAAAAAADISWPDNGADQGCCCRGLAECACAHAHTLKKKTKKKNPSRFRQPVPRCARAVLCACAYAPAHRCCSMCATPPPHCCAREQIVRAVRRVHVHL